MNYPMVRLGDICTVVSGSTPKSNIPEYWDGDVKWITPAELTEDSFIVEDSVRHITELGVQKTGLKPFPAGTVILSSRAPIGKTAIAGCEMYCNQGFKNLICSDCIDSHYLYHFLSSKTEYLNSLGRGATFKEISKGIVENIEIPLPPKAKQTEISDQFAKINELIKLRKEQLSSFDELVKSRFIELFGDLKANPYHWACKNLLEVADIDTVMVNDYEKYANYPHVGIDSIEKNTGRLVGYRTIAEDGVISGKYLFTSKHIIYSKIRPNLNKVALPEFEGLCSADAYPILPKEDICLRTYLGYVLRSEFFLDYILPFSRRANMPKVNKEQLSGFVLPVPNIDLQKQFAAFVEQTDKLKLDIEKSQQTLSRRYIIQ